MDYGYGSYDSTYAGLFGGFTVAFIILILVVLAAAVVGIIAFWKLYKKAGKKGWESIVPFYSYWVLVEISGLNWWWFLLIIATNIVSLLSIDSLSSIASLVSMFASFNCYYNIAKKFNKSTGYSVCAGIFPFIFALILGFSKNEVYNLNIPVSKNGVFGTPEAPSNNSVNNNYQSNIQPQPVYNNVDNTDNNLNSVDTNTSVDAMNNVGTDNGEMNAPEFSFCGNCGTKMSKDTKFCPNCGKANE